MSISRRIPPIVAQTLIDSCWAAALESFSRVAPHIPDHSQTALISSWGEGATGGGNAISMTKKLLSNKIAARNAWKIFFNSLLYPNRTRRHEGT